MGNLAVIDIGSNSITLLLAEIREKRYFRIIDILKETVRLGEGMSDNHNLIKADRMAAALKTLKMFKNLCDATGTSEIIAVATAAVRKTSNRNDFIDKVKKKTGLEVEVLSGEEEGYYDYWGVANSVVSEDGLIIDIGGGSVELIWMKDKKIKENVSLPFGALDLAYKFNTYETINEEQEMKLHTFIKEQYQQLSWLSEIGDIPLIGVGGTIRNIAKIDQSNKDYPLEILHNYQMIKEEVVDIYNYVKNKDLAARKEINGLSKNRADIFVGAIAMVFILMLDYDFSELHICGKGIREGLIYSHLFGDKRPTEDVLDFSIDNFMYYFKINSKHADQVYRLTNDLYEHLKLLFNSPPDNIENIIKVSAKLHDCGTNINYYNHHEHSFYIILNSGLDGLTHREILMSAYIAASHRHTKYNLRKYNLNRANFKQIINKKGKDKELIRKIGILLEIAEGLDRNMKGIIKDLECIITDESIILNIIADDDVKLEIQDALNAGQGFKSLFDKNLIIN